MKYYKIIYICIELQYKTHSNEQKIYQSRFRANRFRHKSIQP